ncbi:flagellar export chaperone FliS [Amphibiibacter pelophylacis]|uniref:Flagellar export chaperone FliS n=1 Tax=Amphibiibacter pelophylacis TaxID=1799477 RepID=A0ACC6NZQ3_9BURK
MTPTARPRAQAYAANAYASTGVTSGVSGASPHRLIELLFDGFVDAVARARGAMRHGDIEQKSLYITKAVRIIDEGLKGGLDLQGGGEIARNLGDLYEFIIIRLTQANLRNDEQALDDCLSVISPIHEAWVAIRPQAS